jgi:maleylpyruvate isomerase
MFGCVTTDPLGLLDDLARADARLMATVDALSPADLAAPSPLPGWSRGHVVTHLARNADGLGNLLTWAKTGVETPMYATATARAEGIEAGASRPLEIQVEDLRDACGRFSAQAAAMPAAAWAYSYGPDRGSAAYVIWRRLREVEIHHVDLGSGYRTSDWPDAFTSRLLRELTTHRDSPIAIALAADSGEHWQIGPGTPGVTVHGPGHRLAAWISGRSTGDDLTVAPAGPLPAIPDWM